MEYSELYKKGLEVRRQLFGEKPEHEERRKMIERLDPAISRHIHEFAFGTIYHRPRFSVKQRQLLALMALIVLDRTPEVRAHIFASLNLGWEKEDILEVIATAIVYGGFPVMVNAVKAAEEVFREWDEKKGTGR
ncbi:MAG: carboxymuconolactone decarboxylase family protein [Nitrospinota bacterium]